MSDTVSETWFSRNGDFNFNTTKRFTWKTGDVSAQDKFSPTPAPRRLSSPAGLCSGELSSDPRYLDWFFSEECVFRGIRAIKGTIHVSKTKRNYICSRSTAYLKEVMVSYCMHEARKIGSPFLFELDVTRGDYEMTLRYYVMPRVLNASASPVFHQNRASLH